LKKLLDSRIRIALLVAVVAAAISIPALAIGSASSAPGVHAAKKKKGRRGPRGKRGPQGIQGVPGKDGVNGKDGPRGPSDVYEASNPNAEAGISGVQLNLPAGNWAVDSSAEVQNFVTTNAPTPLPANPPDGAAECDLFSDEDISGGDGHLLTVPGHGFTVTDSTAGDPQFKGGVATVTPEGVFRLPTGGSVVLECYDYDAASAQPSGTAAGGSDAPEMHFLGFHIHAVQVAAAHAGAAATRRPSRLRGCGTSRTALARCAGVRLHGSRTGPHPPIG
jgi:hypothetical protein